MAEWLSRCIKKQPKVGDALRELTLKINDYRDAAKPSSNTGSRGEFPRSLLVLFRPDWKIMGGICIACGILGVIFSSYVPRCILDKWPELSSSMQNNVADKWTDLALAMTIPVFVLGISLVTLARSISDSGRFAVDYLNESCKMEWFCFLTFIAVLIGIIGRLLCTVEWIRNVATVGICAASLGAAVYCLAMLAFVVFETIRCSVPSKSIGVVSQYAGRKLCYGYLKEAYITLFGLQKRIYLEKWCVGRAIHPPSQYYVHYSRSDLRSGKGNNNCIIELDESKSGQNIYKDYDIERLTELDKYLKDNHAELYLSSPDYESEQGILGILSAENISQNQKMRADVLIMSIKTVKWRSLSVKEQDAELWLSYMSALEKALRMAIKNGESEQVKKYLEVALEPLSVLRGVKGHKIITGEDTYLVRREYDFIWFYLKAMQEILTELKKNPDHGKDRAIDLMRMVRKSIWEKTKKILCDMDYHTMELFTWLVVQMYKLIQDAGDEAKGIRGMRARFGGFYESANGWLDESKSGETDDVDKMRLVLHEGLTRWLLIAKEKKDVELIEQLCDAARVIVFGREGIKFGHRKAILQHFVLAGYLIGLVKSGEVNATAVERLFCEDNLYETSLSGFRKVSLTFS